MEERVRDAESVTFHGAEAAFVDERTLSVGDEEITAENVVITAGSQPVVSSAIDGQDRVRHPCTVTSSSRTRPNCPVTE